MPSRARRVRQVDDDLGVFGLPGDVSPWDVGFDPTDPADLDPVGDGSFRLRVRTEPGLTDGTAVLRQDDRVVAIPLESSSAGRFVWWSAIVGPLAEPAGLSFAFRTERSNVPVYIVPSGTSASVERLDRWIIDPNRAPLDVPEWVQGAVIYQIFPDRFANGDPSNDPPGTVSWGSAPQPRQFQGGDLDGIVARLDHIADLGVDAIYLNPVFRSPSNHKYDTVDYMEVDPAFGGNDALRRLVAACHDRGMRVILDASFNHVHPRFFAFADLVRRGMRSEYRDWFVIRDWPPRVKLRPDAADAATRGWVETWREETGLVVEELAGPGPVIETNYEAWYGVPTMPRLDLSNPDARAYVLGVAQHWLRNFDVDGWRMDVARYVDRDFWPDFRRACREVKPDAYLLAEIMGDVRDWLQGDAFDATMNYSFRSLALEFFGRGTADGATFLDHCTRLYARHALATTLANHNLIGSHDTARFLTEAGGDRWRLELATVFQMTYPGAPGIYYGDEVGLLGDNDPGCRGAMPWEEIETRRGVMSTISELARLRRRSPVLRFGGFVPVAADHDVAAFERRLGRSRMLVAFNRSAWPVTIEVDAAEILWGRGQITASGIVLEGRSAVIARR
ncbi:MAG: glycoside hydrolase family 13 protein [Acidimicrobiia bacterium]